MKIRHAILGLVLAASVCVGQVFAADDRKVTVAWDPSDTGPPVAGTGGDGVIGTFIYLGQWTNKVDVYGLRKIDVPYAETNGVWTEVSRCTITNLSDTMVYAAYCTAYNTHGLESDNSNTIRWEYRETRPGVPLTFDMSLLSTNWVTYTNATAPWCVTTNGQMLTFTPPPKLQGKEMVRMTATETNLQEGRVGLYTGITITNRDNFFVSGIQIVP